MTVTQSLAAHVWVSHEGGLTFCDVEKTDPIEARDIEDWVYLGIVELPFSFQANSHND